MTPETTSAARSASTGADHVERVVLLSADGHPIGAADKATVHTEDTPLHLAFSVHLRARDGRVLLTRRALSKKTWPGVWTNAFCGHPAPDETFGDAIRRRAATELNLDPALLTEPSVVVPDFQYRAVDASGIVENEICPVHVVDYAGDPEELPAPEPSEVMDSAWVRWEALTRVAADLPQLISPWLVDQIAHQQLDRALRAD